MTWYKTHEMTIIIFPNIDFRINEYFYHLW